jgi:hypothetical protein
MEVRLFICGLFDDAVINSDFIASGSFGDSNELSKIGKEAVMG